METEEKKSDNRGRRKRYRVVYDRDKGICQICKKPISFADGTTDHIIPRAHGGTNDWDNLQLACQPCNSEKGSSYDCPCGLPPNAPGCRIGVEAAWTKYAHDLEYRQLYREWVEGLIPKIREGWALPNGHG